MNTNSNFPPHEGVPLSQLARLCGAELVSSDYAQRVITGVAPISRADHSEISFANSRSALPDLKKSTAGAVFVKQNMLCEVPSGVAALVVSAPQTAFAMACSTLFPSARQPLPLTSTHGIAPTAIIDPSARIEDNVKIEAGVIIGANVEIGSGSVIAAGAAIGNGSCIGRNCHIGHAVTIQHSLIGNNVIIHPKASIGQDGFGYAPGPKGLLKIPQIGRVIIQDDVEIGANTAIDRGALDDTVIGEGTKIDNLVQIGHNVRIGRHCAIVAQVGISGSTIIGDGVMIGGACGIAGHLTIGDGVQLAALSGVATDVPAGARWGGIPARPMMGFLRDAADAIAMANGKSGRAKKKRAGTRND